MYAASSCDALGITPGSVNVVLNREPIVKKYKIAPTIGIAGVMCTVKYGQLFETRKKTDN